MEIAESPRWPHDKRVPHYVDPGSAISVTAPSTRTWIDSTDQQLVALAWRTQCAISWQQILNTRGGADARWQWKWRENVRNISIYTNQDATQNTGHGGIPFAVLAIGVVKGGVAEIVSLLTSHTQREYTQKMRALHGKDFKRGAYIREVLYDNEELPIHPDATEHEHNRANPTLGGLSVRMATFGNSRWLSHDDDWCYLEDAQYDEKNRRFEQLFTTLDHPPNHSHTQKNPLFRGLMCGYLIEAEETKTNIDTETEMESSFPSHASTRVQFYAELALPGGNAKAQKTKAATQRMLQIARSCDRLAQLVRRRRLGLQVLTSPCCRLATTSMACVNCDVTKLLAKRCRVCGQIVCGDCSDKYERETLSGTETTRIDTVRVCDPCLMRVESANYECMSDAALCAPVVFPDSTRSTGSHSQHSFGSSASADLKHLLQDALLQAPSPQRKSAVVRVIRSVLDQEKELLMQSFARDEDPDAAASMLGDLKVPQIACRDAEVADRDGRAYTIPVKGYPVPADETRRLEAIQRLDVHRDGTSDELNIICDIAAKEMGAVASIVTILTQDRQCVIGANAPRFERMNTPRENSFCQHTIMDSKPLIVPHPEADVRFSSIPMASSLGIRYYCGFPITAENGAVVGTLCCLDQKSHDMTESQYTALHKLAQTAAKVVRLQGDLKRGVSLDASKA